MAILTLTNKDIVTMTLPAAHGRNTVIADIQNLIFDDVLFPDGTKVKDTTFNQLSDQVWTYVSKHDTTLINATKN